MKQIHQSRERKTDLHHTWAPSDQWVYTDQLQRSGTGVQTNWNFWQTNWNFMVVYTLLKKHAFAVLKCQKNGPSDQSEMTQDQLWPQGAHVWSAYPSIQEYQNLEGKLKHNLTAEWSGNNWGAIGEWLWSEYERGQRLAVASKKILWHSVRLTWNTVDLRRKYTRRTQDGWKQPIQCLQPVLCPRLPSH